MLGKSFITKEELQQMIYPIIKKNENKIHCIDGRKIIIDGNEEFLKEGLAYPGGQMGILSTILSVFDNLDDIEEKIGKKYRENIIKIVKDFFGGEIKYHTDDHCPCEKVGCGHLDLLFNKQNDYHISNKSKELILNEIKSCNKSSIEILKGNHGEKGLLVIEGEPGFGISNFDSKGSSYFTLTRSSNEKILFDLAKYIIAHSNKSYFDSANVLFKLILASRNYQLNNTVSNLAPNDPMATIFINAKGIIKEIIYENN